MEGIFADPRFGVFGYLTSICHHRRWVRDLRKHVPRDGLDLRDFTRVQQCIRGTTECSPDIESDDKLSRKTRVTCAGCVHDGSQRAIDRFEYFLGTRHTFPLHNGTRQSHISQPHIEVDAIN